MSIGAVVTSRNDGYGGDQFAKALYSLSSMISAFDEVFMVDWNSPGTPFVEIIKDYLPHTGKFKYVVVPPRLALELANNNPNTQECIEVLARNIGLRRMTSDYLISANPDIMVLERSSVERTIRGKNTFHVNARRETPFLDVLQYGKPCSKSLLDSMYANIDKYHQLSSDHPDLDQWSLISCPGDFQLAHRDIWHAIRGFEETLVLRGYSDSNVQRKAAEAGFELLLVRDIPIFHLRPYEGTGYCGGMPNIGMNDADFSLWKFAGTTNKDTWGFANFEFEVGRV